MDETKGFYDYCIPYNNDNKVLREMCQQLVEMGYRTIAIEQQFDHTEYDSKRKVDMIPAPFGLTWLRNEFDGKLKILNRLTILYEDCNITHALNNSLNFKKYHIIAGQPTKEAALTHCCTTFNGDIITLRPQEGAKYFVNHKTYQMAVKRSMFFEIKYALCIQNSTYRKSIIRTAFNFFAKGKSKNVILSSGATNIFELRSPFDVANMSFIFSLSEDQGKCAVDRYGKRLYLRAESRRFGRTIMFVKSSGPVVFSDSSDDDSKSSEESVQPINSILDISNINELTIYENEPPTKKQKVCLSN